jgi:hypothetical protein
MKLICECGNEMEFIEKPLGEDEIDEDDGDLGIYTDTDLKKFDTWAEHGIKQDFSYLIDGKQAPLIRKYFIDDDDYYWDKYSRLYLDDILDRIDGGNIDKGDIEGLKQELRDLNFGSMEYDW